MEGHRRKRPGSTDEMVDIVITMPTISPSLLARWGVVRLACVTAWRLGSRRGSRVLYQATTSRSSTAVIRPATRRWRTCPSGSSEGGRPAALRRAGRPGRPPTSSDRSAPPPRRPLLLRRRRQEAARQITAALTGVLRAEPRGRVDPVPLGGLRGHHVLRGAGSVPLPGRGGGRRQASPRLAAGRHCATVALRELGPSTPRCCPWRGAGRAGPPMSPGPRSSRAIEVNT